MEYDNMDNFKVRCVRSSDYFTIGKVYEVSGKRITGDKNFSYWKTFTSVEEINDELHAKFELVEETKPTEENKNMRFRKEDLKLFDVVEWRNGNLMLVIEHYGEKLFSGITVCEHNEFCYYDEFLKNKHSYEYEPIRVYRPKYSYSLKCLMVENRLEHYDLIWEEPKEEPKEVEVTIDEIAEKFGINVEQLKIIKG